MLSIATGKDELKLLSPLNTLGYVEFDVLCNLSCLEDGLFANSKLSWLSHNTYHFIDKYNFKGEFVVQQFYICSNLSSPFAMQQYDQLEGCNIYNNVMWRIPNFVLKKHVKFQEGEHCCPLPTICPLTKTKPRTVCCREGEDDEDMTPSDMTVDYKVSPFLLLFSFFCPIYLVPHVYVIICW